MPHQPQPIRPPSGNHHPPSSAIETNSGHPSVIVETLEHRRFAEFCDACRRYGYIGLCYGPPGVGKTLSARSYSRWDKVNQADRWGTGPGENPALDTVFYTPAVVNVPGKVDAEIKRWRDTLRDLTRQPLRLEREARLEALRRRDKEHLAKLLDEDRDWLTEPVPELHPTYGEVAKEYLVKDMQLCDPTTLILIDEADRLRMTSLEQVRAIFDAGTIGVILIGMPGLEKRLARYPQFYSGAILLEFHSRHRTIETGMRRLVATNQPEDCLEHLVAFDNRQVLLGLVGEEGRGFLQCTITSHLPTGRKRQLPLARKHRSFELSELAC
jgi:hypothetical protein